jgi:hypothetical protein
VEADNRTVSPSSALRCAWDAKCLASPHGMLHTTISGGHRKMRSNGELIEVMPVGEIARASM